MIAPFLQPDLLWDFRLARVASISTSAHKYGLVYPGLGWVIWRTVDDLPKELVFDVTYLGGHMPSFALNFSRPGRPGAAAVLPVPPPRVGRLLPVQKASQDVAVYLAGEIGRMPAFELWNDGTDIPVFAWQLAKGYTDKWNLYHLSERLRLKGWLIPAYPMPDDLTDIVVQRIVVRNGLSRNLAESLVIDIARGRRLPRRARGADADGRTGVVVHPLSVPPRGANPKGCVMDSTIEVSIARFRSEGGARPRGA